jgi:hypothetical protein
MFESGADQRLQVIHFEIGGDLAFEALPRVAWAFDEFNGIGHLA